LVTTDEKGVTNPTLFNTAGMQPLIPYLLGKPYLIGGQEVKRLADAQKCLRTVDIDDIGDKTHATFFEMLGNWSLGDYFKEEAIKWSYEFLTSKSETEGDRGLGLDPDRLYITVFEGDANAPKDTEAFDIWKKYIPEDRIYFLPAGSNWWEAGDNGPCGPDSEMYYDVTKEGLGDIDKEGFLKADKKRDVVEIWNDVFMQYEKKDGKIIGNLAQLSIDTGAGLERLAMTLQGKDNIYETNMMNPVMEKIRRSSKDYDLKAARIVADHIKASVFLITDGVNPSNTDRGYVLRKLLRRAVRYADKLGTSEGGRLDQIADAIIEAYKGIHKAVYDKKDQVISEILKEEARFRQTLKQGLKEFEKGTDAFTLFSSYGFPLELTVELAKEKGTSIDIGDFEKKFKKHQELSRSGAEQKFKGGLADADDPMVVRYHTATHLLHQALHDVLGDGVSQKGSNITPERLRFDFSYGAKMTDEQKKAVEDIVNEKISQRLPVNKTVMPIAEAEKTGARHSFGERYGDEVSIYFIGPSGGGLEAAYSKEFCGGPHVGNTGELAGPEGKWRFKISKEEAVAQGIRRIKAVMV
jgi:alanyl-tRNA synthetase